jgi:hypothetical protein
MSDAGRIEAAAASGREDAAYQAAFESMRYDAAVWYDALEKAIPGTLAAADDWDREHGIVRTDRRTPDDAVIAYRIRIDDQEYLLHPSDVDIVRPVPVGAQGEAQ